MGEDYFEKCVKKLEYMGFKVNTSILNDSIKKAVSYVKKFCNIRKIPEELTYEVVDYACGLSLEIMKNSGLLESENLKDNKGVKQIKEGDVSVTYDEKYSDNNKLDNIIFILKNIDSILTMYRKVVW